MLAQKKIDFDDWAKYLQIYSMNEPTYVLGGNDEGVWDFFMCLAKGRGSLLKKGSVRKREGKKSHF